MSKLPVYILALSLLLTGCAPVLERTEAATGSIPETYQVLETQISTETGDTLVEVTSTAVKAIPSETAVEKAEPSETAVPFEIEDVIEFEMRGAFDFFWEQANTDETSAGYGLIRDRYPGSAGISSIASTGFGLTAYLIGIEKGYITYEQGYERASRTLDTLLAMDRVEGFYYHFVEMSTGKRAWNSEVSNIDTSILLMGVLSVGEYFGGEIGEKAEQIYQGVNWPWFIDESENMFFMAYRPEKGFEGHWDFYAEQLMLYILAAGSDTFPVDGSTYYGFIRHYGSFGEGEPFIHSWFGSIFTYQYSHAWIDFRAYGDKEGVNWFENSVEASLSQVNFAAAMDEKYTTLGPDAWGLSACDGPEGYNGLYGAPPSGYDNNAHHIDDTIPPSGAIGSILFVPQHTQLAMMNYYSIERLKGEYGFLDAYNLSQDWYATDVIGIDKGISLLMLANYEGGYVYEVMMKNERILNGLERLQITKNEQEGGNLFRIGDIAQYARVSIRSTTHALFGISIIEATTHAAGNVDEMLWINKKFYRMN